ncbi:MAG: hypothetical protein QQN41_03125 [Nitrosopumilus sp.]
MTDNSKYPRGSEWRKWDLHVHTPNTQKNDCFRTTDKSKDVWGLFCENIENSDVDVIGITDYFSVTNYFNFVQIFKKKYPNSTKIFFPNIELCTSDVVNKASEEVNMHLIFDPEISQKQIHEFLKNLKTNKTDTKGRNIKALELTSKNDFEEATTTRAFIEKAFKNTFGDKAKLLDYFLIITAVNNDGARPTRGVKRKEIISDEIDKFSHGFFGGSQNTKYFLETGRLESEDEIAPKPVICCSDVHSFEDMNIWLGKEFINQNGEKVKEISWIKADPTFEGLKQILYEPESGERVKISPIKPDHKDDYKVISKIRFKHSNDFPNEIEFNQNLCSIIGSRSSGKSALLAYIAHSIDAELAERMVLGPGEGEEYHWAKIDLDYTIEWNNGKSNDECPGKIIYVPQNYLFEKSKDSDEIKDKINPVLFRVLPEFEVKYTQAEKNIELHNQQILEHVDVYFELSDSIKSIDEKLKDLGNKNAIEEEKKQIESKIKYIKEKNQLSDEELKRYQEISSTLSTIAGRIEEIYTELSQISEVSEDQIFFSGLKITLFPALANLPTVLQAAIREKLEKKEGKILEEINKQVVEYKKSVEIEKKESEEKVLKIKKGNIKLIDKYQKNVELEGFMEKFNEYNKILKKIEDEERKKKKTQDEINKCVKTLKAKLDLRKSIIEDLETSLESSDQSSIESIRFMLEYGFNANLEDLMSEINIKERSDFIEKGQLKINNIREKPGEFLLLLYSGKQKVISGYAPKVVAKDTLSLTEKILFTAEMEGDKIGGFSEPTMTPGKRALFLLRLILTESDDTWPLLIDQPEDDLDSRSIYYDIVPFLKEKKKERQIIMVSHDANLVIGSDSEQFIVANRDGTDRKNTDGLQFNYLTGSLEYTKQKDETCEDTLKSQGVREHACEILDGGKIAFEQRRNKYNIN